MYYLHILDFVPETQNTTCMQCKLRTSIQRIFSKFLFMWYMKQTIKYPYLVNQIKSVQGYKEFCKSQYRLNTLHTNETTKIN